MLEDDQHGTGTILRARCRFLADVKSGQSFNRPMFRTSAAPRRTAALFLCRSAFNGNYVWREFPVSVCTRGGCYHHMLQSGFIDDWPGIQIPHFKITHTHTHRPDRARHTSTQIKDRGETCSGEDERACCTAQKAAGTEEEEEEPNTTTTKWEQMCPLGSAGNIRHKQNCSHR